MQKQCSPTIADRHETVNELLWARSTLSTWRILKAHQHHVALAVGGMEADWFRAKMALGFIVILTFGI